MFTSLAKLCLNTLAIDLTFGGLDLLPKPLFWYIAGLVSSFNHYPQPTRNNGKCFVSQVVRNESVPTLWYFGLNFLLL